MTRKISTNIKPAPVLGTALGAAVFGAVIGGTAAAAKGLREVKAGRATSRDVTADVAREAGSTAVAVGTATAVVGALSLGPFLSALGIAALATGTKYAMDSLVQAKKPEQALAAPAKAAAPKTGARKKAAATKTTSQKPVAKKPAAKKPAAGKTAETKAKAEKPAPKTETKTDKA